MQIGVICAFLRMRMYKYSFVSECFDIDAVIGDMDKNFFKALFSLAHCLHPLLPSSCQKQSIRAPRQGP